jgi:hypothetical protein
MKAAIAIRFLMVLWIFIGCIVAANAEENRKKPSAFQEAIDAIDAQPRKSLAAEALKNLTGMTPEEYEAAQASRRCYDVVMPPRGGQSSIITPVDSILLNRCTGETWLLVKTPTAKQGGFSYRWFSVRTVPDEAVVGP